MNQEQSIREIDESVLIKLVVDGAADMAMVKETLTLADELASQSAIYAGRAADEIRRVIERGSGARWYEKSTRSDWKEIQALALAAGINAQMTIYRIREAAERLTP